MNQRISHMSASKISVPATRYLRSLIIVSISIVGCGQPDSREGLSGEVTLKGELLKSGSIQFESVEGQSPVFSTGAMIRDGAFTVPGKSGLPAGKYRVMINAASAPFLATGPPGSQPVMETKELVPAAYNTDSEVTVEVSADGENTFDFAIP